MLNKPLKMIINKKLKWNSTVIGEVLDNKASKTKTILRKKKRALRLTQMTFLEMIKEASTNSISKSITRQVHSLRTSSSQQD